MPCHACLARQGTGFSLLDVAPKFDEEGASINPCWRHGWLRPAGFPLGLPVCQRGRRSAWRKSDGERLPQPRSLDPSSACGFFHGYTVQNPVLAATQWLHGPEKKKPRYCLDSRVSFTDLVPVR